MWRRFPSVIRLFPLSDCIKIRIAVQCIQFEGSNGQAKDGDCDNIKRAISVGRYHLFPTIGPLSCTISVVLFLKIAVNTENDVIPLFSKRLKSK